MKKSKAPAPDPLATELAKQNAATSAEMSKIARETLDFNKQQYADQMAEADRLQPVFDAILQGTIDANDLAMDVTRTARDDYNRIYRPVEERVAADAMAAGTPGEQELAAGRAGIDVQRNLDTQRGVTDRNLQSMGVNPNSGRFVGQSRSDEIMGAAVRAGAETAARAAEKQRGDILRSSVADRGRGQQAAALTGVGVTQQGAGATAGAAGLGLNTRAGIGANYAAGMGAGANIYAGAAGVNAGAAGILDNQYRNRLAGWQASKAANAAKWGSIGGAIGMATGFFA